MEITPRLCTVVLALSSYPPVAARFCVHVLTSLIRTPRDTVRRMLMAYIEGTYIFKTRSTAVYPVMEESGIKDLTVQKELYDRAAKSLRKYPIPESNGVQSALDSLTHPNAKTAKPASLMNTTILEKIKKSGFINKLYGRTG